MMMNGLTAARLMMERRGYVVVGLIDGEESLSAGTVLRSFAGWRLRDCHLVVKRSTTRKEWNAQVIEIFGDPAKDKNVPARGQRFYRCELVEGEAYVV